MTHKTKRASDTVKAPNAGPQDRQLPPDPDGLFERAAARGKKVVAMYDDLNPGWEPSSLVTNLLHDLMHLSDRDPELGDIGERYVDALRWYEKFVRENKWMVE